MILSQKEEDKVRCLLCPHECLLDYNEFGKCRIRKSNGEHVELHNYGAISSMAVEPIEKKPFKHFLTGTRTLSLGDHGCSLFCAFCENFKISQVKDVPTKNFEPKDIVDIAIQKGCKSVCMTYSEPTIVYEYLIDVANESHKHGLKFVLKTNAYCNKEPWGEICNVVDAINIDWKGSEKQYREICGVDHYVLLDRIREAFERDIHIEISIPIYDTFISDIRPFFKCGLFLESLNSEIPCHVLTVHPSFKHIDRKSTSKDILDFVSNILSVNMKNVYIVD